MNESTINPRGANEEPGGSYAPVNGLNLYYEIHGTGKPLVLLHGGFGTIGMFFAQLLPALAATRQAIAVELQAHGHTADIDRPLRYELLADDIAALLEYLGCDADIFGYSLGGGVALQTAIRHPEVVRKLVIASAPCKRDGWYPEDLAGMASLNAEALAGTIIHDAYVSAAPRPEDWPTLVAKMRQLLSGQDYDWSAAVAALKAPTLIVVGDADGIRLEHAVEMFGLLGGKGDGDMGGGTNSQLAVLPGTRHWDVPFRTELLLPMITLFLDTPMPEAALHAG
jgi:pimeloyl-ACP methyl ester carboxylesterase